MRRPVLIGGAVLLFLLVLGAPFARIHIGFSDDRAMPTTVESRLVGDTIRNEFPGQATAAVDVVIDDAVSADRLDGYAKALSRLAHVVTVTTPSATFAEGRRMGGIPTATTDGARPSSLMRIRQRRGRRLLEQIRTPQRPELSWSVDPPPSTSTPQVLWSHAFRWPPR
jgi:RND superfamily putative drug exporter